jgi:hypothetical protein
MAQQGDIVICPRCGREGELNLETGMEDLVHVIHSQHLSTREVGSIEVSWRSTDDLCVIDRETAQQLSSS